MLAWTDIAPKSPLKEHEKEAAPISHRINFVSRRRAYFLSVHRHDSSGLIERNPAIRGAPTGVRR
jgi:hypothetical protein